MRIFLEKKVDLEVKTKNIKFIYFLDTGVKSAKEGLVSLSPADATIHPSSSKYFLLQLKCNKKQKGPKGLFVDETIEESNYGQPKGLSSFYERHNHSDTILNSTESYPKKSTITTNKKRRLRWAIPS